jgi:endoglucanase
MLRAVWMDDKQTFDSVFDWTQNNLQKRPGDNLFSWKWGQHSDGTWGVLIESGGSNSATDADLDTAFALILANKRWNQQHYIDEAKRILNDVWSKEVITINDKPYLVAGDWAANEDSPTINPSYFNFAGYSIFAEVDPTHDWNAVKDTSYEVLNASTSKLPPDWVSINRTTGKVETIVLDGKTSNFSDDAVRIPWRVALDWKWNRDQRALAYLEKLSFLQDEWKSHHTIYKEYTQDGQAMSNQETLSTYGALLPYFQIIDPKAAQEIYFEKLGNDYNPDIFDFKTDIGYYSKNWAWFGMALYENRLINTYQTWKETL